EKLKIEHLRVSHTASDDTWTKIRNGALFVNGVQVGSTADINEDTQSTAYTQYNLGSSLIVEPGHDVTLEVRGDVFNVNTASALSAGTTTVINIAAGGTNIQRMVSGNYISNTAISGNTLTVAAGTLSLAKYSAYANQTITVPQTAYKIGEYRLTTGSTEPVNLNTFTLTLAGDLAATSTDATELYVVYGTKTSQVKAAGAASQSWSINESVAANTTINIAVYSTLSSAITSGKFTATGLTVAGTSQNSGSAVTSSAVTGQTITVGAGTVTAVKDASSPVSSLVVANSMPKVASFKFTGTNDAFTITQLFAKVASTDAAAAIAELVWKDGATEVARQPMNGYGATSSGLSIAIPANGSKVLDVYANLGSIGTNAATTSANIGVSLRRRSLLPVS
ncbi:MAG: Glycoprotein gp2, partial [Candidatus Giovannonibacteria bacterium GW2011_GWA2_53_7]